MNSCETQYNSTTFPIDSAMGDSFNPHTALLEAFFPGFSLISGLLKYAKIDLTVYLPVLLALGAIIFASQYVSNSIWGFVEQHFMSKADIRADDEMYNMLMGWIANQKFAKRSRRFVANTNLNSRMWYLWYNNDKEDIEDETIDFDADSNPVVKIGGKQEKQVRFTPSFGTHYFWYQRHLLILRRQRDERQISFGSASENEEISISCLGRNPAILKVLLDECRGEFTKSDETRTIIYRGSLTPSKGSAEPKWTRCASRVSRPFSTVILDETVKNSLLADMKDYLHPYTRRYYSNRGIPYRRGYLFHGSPGTGKSSLCFAIAGYFKLKIYIVSLNSSTMQEEHLATLFSELPKQCVVLLEDIDTAGLTHTREDKNDDLLTSPLSGVTSVAALTPPAPAKAEKISLSGLLNILDGVASQEGRILIMTTNHINKLDEALIRPGRVDMTVKFDLASTAMISTIFRAIFATLEGDIPTLNSAGAVLFPPTPSPKKTQKQIFDDKTREAEELKAEQEFLARKQKNDEKVGKLAEEFASLVPEGIFSPAEIQGYLLIHKREPEKAVEGAVEWVQKTKTQKRVQAEKEKREEEERIKAERERDEKATKEKADKERDEKAGKWKLEKDKATKEKADAEDTTRLLLPPILLRRGNFYLDAPIAHPELQRQLAFTTASSTKKRKLSPPQDIHCDPDTPLSSVEDSRNLSSGDYPLQFESSPDVDLVLPQPIPSYLQSSSSLAGTDYISSAASSPSAAYSGLSLEGERGADSSAASQRATSLAPDIDTYRSLSPIGSVARRAMGAATENNQRSSSPLKRRASDLEEPDVATVKQEDVEMTSAPAPEVSESSPTSDSSPQAELLNPVKTDNQTPNNASPANSTSDDVEPEIAIPTIDAQIKTITTIAKASAQGEPEEGAGVYLVSKRWLKRVQDRGTEAKQHSKVQPEGEIGPVDNSDLIQEIITDAAGNKFAKLRPEVSRDLEIFPKDAWDMIIDWYGIMPGTVPILRHAHNTNEDKHGMPNMEYEFYPPIFTVHRLWGGNNPILIPQSMKTDNPPAPVFILSRTSRYVDFLEKIKQETKIEKSKKVKIWRIPRSQPAANTTATAPNAATPPSSRPGSPATDATAVARQPQDSWTQLLLDVTAFTALPRERRELIDHRDVSADSKYNGGMTLAFVGLGEDQQIVIDEMVDQFQYVSNYSASVRPSNPNCTAMVRSTGVSQSASSSGRNSPGPSGPMTRGRAQKNGKTLGMVGLQNLGNTCYMNSALQCVRSVEELTKYFLTGKAVAELNTDNPLGNGGAVAMAYQRLLEEMYKHPVPGSVAPRNFKSTIGRYAPSFSGYGQQDSQEFLGFLLDGLQEDLSRILKKPYIEKPDSTDDMINNPQAIRDMADKVWSITKQRDDSVIADLFTGMYKSTLVCPVCSKVSITFDPFNNLTLQLPIESVWNHRVFYFPLNDTPVTIDVDMDKQGSVLALKEFISTRVGVPAEKLFVAEEFKSKFYKILKNDQIASDEISHSDIIAVYELEVKPTNWPPRRIKKAKNHNNLHNNDSENDEIPAWDDPMAEKMLVPVFHRRPNSERSRFKKNWVLIPAPHFIILDPKEARDLEIIKRKILEKVATLSTSLELQEDDDPADASVSDSVASDIVLTTGSDADSSGGSKLVAKSVDGDSELVDIAMKDSSLASVEETSVAATSVSGSEKSSLLLKNFNKRRPKFLTPGSYLNPSLQNMFTLGHFSTNKEMIPSGWNVIDDDKSYPSLQERVPRFRGRSPDRDSEVFEVESNRGGSESSVEDDTFRSDNSYSNQTRMNDESSGDELAPAPVVSRGLPVRQKAGMRVGFKKRRNSKLTTYSKKGNQQTSRKVSHGSGDQEESSQDEGPLVRLGEGIVVDWNHKAWQAMYDGTPGDTMRGRDTTNSVPHLPDPELDARKKARSARRKNGITLEDCFDEFGKEEILSEMDTWYCPRCKEHRRASKKFELWKTPDILVMHLKRFSSNAMRRDKLDIMVDFPIEGLDLTSRVVETEEGKQEIYDLIAVDDHWGSLGGGHYTAFAKSFVDGQWYEYNDSFVYLRKDPSCVVTDAAYLLFYRRRSEVPLGGERFKQILEQYDNPDEFQDETADSGEDRSLGGNTFLSGSSSATTGVGAAHRQPNLGSASAGNTISPRILESLPAYQSHEENEDAAPLLVEDTMMNDGLPINSIETDDEGLGDMGDSDGMNYTNYNTIEGNGFTTANWSFANINPRGVASGTGSDDMLDGRSDRAENNSSASESSNADRLRELSETDAVNEDGSEFIDQSYVPDVTDPDQMNIMNVHKEIIANRAAFKVGSSIDVDEDEPPVDIDPNSLDEWQMGEEHEEV